MNFVVIILNVIIILGKSGSWNFSQHFGRERRWTKLGLGPIISIVIYPLTSTQPVKVRKIVELFYHKNSHKIIPLYMIDPDSAFPVFNISILPWKNSIPYFSWMLLIAAFCALIASSVSWCFNSSCDFCSTELDLKSEKMTYRYVQTSHIYFHEL